MKLFFILSSAIIKIAIKLFGLKIRLWEDFVGTFYIWLTNSADDLSLSLWYVNL